MATIKFDTGIDASVVSEKSKDILSKAGDASKNFEIRITSTIRPPARQAKAMYDNLRKGIKISYLAPGQAVANLYNAKESEEVVLKRMVAKIIELAMKGQRVSQHCVSEEQYADLNVIDITKSIPNPRDFVKALILDNNVVRVITPYASSYNSTKASVDSKEPAIHVEVRQ